jgi:hypothetical protein
MPDTILRFTEVHGLHDNKIVLQKMGMVNALRYIHVTAHNFHAPLETMGPPCDHHGLLGLSISSSSFNHHENEIYQYMHSTVSKSRLSFSPSLLQIPHS